ncbi:hypothetical protein [Mesoflavibacter zeaxanthinifaciens]|uniref:hypothetical protein n=1 Tax=Mesoflavibacter zeaxanthinifaciens TaxID=393060 RepID=UPI003A91A925
MTLLLWILGTLIIIIVSVYVLYFIPLRKDNDRFEYVFVEENGTVRELYRHEKSYLKESFLPNDGARPYIKLRYKSKGLDGKINGFILRKRIPKNINIFNPILEIETWRKNWILIIKDLTNLEYQKQTWLNQDNKNIYYSFVEFMCSYFDDLDLDDGYEKFIKWGFVTQKEYDSISKWHNLLSEYKPPNNNDYSHSAILNDKKWIDIVELGKISLLGLKPNLNNFERALLI